MIGFLILEIRVQSFIGSITSTHPYEVVKGAFERAPHLALAFKGVKAKARRKARSVETMKLDIKASSSPIIRLSLTAVITGSHVLQCGALSRKISTPYCKGCIDLRRSLLQSIDLLGRRRLLAVHEACRVHSN